MNIKKVGKILLIGLMMISIPIWLIVSEVKESDLIFYVGFIFIILFIAIGVLKSKL